MAMPMKKQADFLRDLSIADPLQRAERCLDLWLKEEKRDMPQLSRQRLAALIARYFLHEDEVNDMLILSFLRHYSGRREIDMDDAGAVKNEIKSLLDSAAPRSEVRTIWPMFFAALGFLVALLVSGYHLSQKKITDQQARMLKEKVAEVVKQNPDLSAASIWARVKKDMDVKKYEDISYWRYKSAEENIERIKGNK